MTRAVLVVLLAAVGCATSGGPRPIPSGAECARCGMAIQDLRFACEDRTERRYRFYDSIECLLQAPGGARAWVADYDSRELHDADSMWVVRASIPSPMGGGYAAFIARESAEEIARMRDGRVGRLGDFAVDGRGRGGAR